MFRNRVSRENIAKLRIEKVHSEKFFYLSSREEFGARCSRATHKDTYFSTSISRIFAKIFLENLDNIFLFSNKQKLNSTLLKSF